MKYGLRPSTFVDSFFKDDFFSNFTYGSELDIYKEGENYFVELEIPGFSKEDINIEFKGDILSIKAEHKLEEKKEERNYFYRSRSYQNIHRQIRFNDIDDTNIQAEYTDGVLKIMLPSKVAEDTHRRIEVK